MPHRQTTHREVAVTTRGSRFGSGGGHGGADGLYRAGCALSGIASSIAGSVSGAGYFASAMMSGAARGLMTATAVAYI